MVNGGNSTSTFKLNGFTVGPSAVDAPLPFAYLPVEGCPNMLSENHAIVYHVLRNLGDPTEVARAATVSRLWHDVASIPSLWTALLEREHRAASSPSITVDSQGANADRMPSACNMPCGTTSQSGRLQQSTQQPPSCRLHHCSQQQRLYPLLPEELLQPPCDVMNSPVEQLGRWMGIRRLEPAASRLDRVRGSWAAYEPVTSRLVVLDQKEQKIAFVDLDLDLAGQSGGDCGRGCGHGGVDCPRGSALTEVSDAVDVDDAIKCCTAGAGAELDRPWGSSSNCGGNGNTDSRSIHIDDDVPCVRRQLHELQKPEAQPMRIVTPGPLMPAVLHMPVPDPDPEPHQAGVAAALIQAPGAMLGEQQLLQQAAGVGPAPPDAPQQQVEQQQPNNGPEMLSQEERHKLQVVATCGNGMVATGHPDGRVLIWDASRAAVAYTLPRVEGCGRGPVLAVAADDMFLAAAYSGEVMVWEIRRCRGKFVRDGDGKERVAAHHFTSSPPSLLALIKPTLATAVRSMALSSRHCVLAMRSWDGVELREIRGGRWLNSISDRRNTALLAAGDVLFVASSSPSFLGNSFLQFEIEVMAIDLPAVMAAAAAADVGRDG
ncbi:hypothetical protein Vretimale_13541, partial [Volvox reticuliferus]